MVLTPKGVSKPPPFAAPAGMRGRDENQGETSKMIL